MLAVRQQLGRGEFPVISAFGQVLAVLLLELVQVVLPVRPLMARVLVAPRLALVQRERLVRLLSRAEPVEQLLQAQAAPVRL